ncbi:MAG: hypothetical protein U9N59_10395 [Campylobacterota bacterium]|nr:hypothetical protein [Campylobacterota bacterium]
MTIRKNFLFEEDVVKHLKDIAKKTNMTQTQVIKDLIEEKYTQFTVSDRLEAFKSIVEMPAGSLVGKTVQSIKSDMAI